MNNRSIAVFKILGVLIPAILFFSIPVNAQPTVTQGTLDLRTFSFTEQPETVLNGDWEFYWQQLYEPAEIPDTGNKSYFQVPKLWNEDYNAFGYATYKIQILLPEDRPYMALSIPDLYSSYVLYANGEEIARNGEVGRTKDAYTPKWIPLTVSRAELQADTVELVLQIANFDHSKGGIRLPIKLGAASHLYQSRERELGYTYSLTGALIMGGLFFFGLYFFGKDQKTILYFSLFCLAYSYRFIGTDLYPLHALLPDIPWIITVKLEYAALFISGYLFGIYTLHLYPRQTSRRIMYIVSGISLIFTAVTILATPYIFTYLLEPYLGILVIYIFYSMYVYVQAVWNKEEGARYALASTGVVFFVFIYEILVYTGYMPKSLLLYFWGYMMFFFLQSLVLSYRFAASLKRATKRAEAASEAKSQFLSTMSHEIRTPLNAIIGLSELMLKSHTEEQKNDFASNIKTSGENLLEIINNILDYTKFDTMEVETEQQELSLSQLMGDVIDMLRPLAEQKNLNLTAAIEPDVDDLIISDRTRIKQILINLTGNAIKFTDEGEVSLNISLNNNPDIPGDLLFTVSDTGAGIPPEKYDLLFKSFSQVDSSLTRKHGGTGLGLAISKKLADAMNGKIWVQNHTSRGRGTEFKFTIQTGTTATTDLHESASGKHKTRVIPVNELKLLLVEDNLLNQKVARHILKTLGITGDTANNGIEAIEMSRQKAYDIILMDIEMPEMDGLAATRKIRDTDNLSHEAIIIAMTANVFAEDKESCLQAGMNDFISKPVSTNSLKRVINKWVSVS